MTVNLDQTSSDLSSATNLAGRTNPGAVQGPITPGSTKIDLPESPSASQAEREQFRAESADTIRPNQLPSLNSDRSTRSPTISNQRISAVDILAGVNKHFEDYDRGPNYGEADGVISKEELGKALESANGSKARELQLLALTGANTRDDLEKFEARLQGPEGPLIRKDLEAFLNQPTSKNVLPPGGKLDPRAVSQGCSADCWVLAPIAAVTQTRPDFFKDAIRPQPDGSVSVALKGMKDRKINVAAISDGEQLIHNNGASLDTDHGSWASYVEKAFAQDSEKTTPAPTRIQGTKSSIVVREDQKGHTVQEAVVSEGTSLARVSRGGEAATSLQAFTGLSYTDHVLSSDLQPGSYPKNDTDWLSHQAKVKKIDQVLRASLTNEEKFPVVAGTPKILPPFNSKEESFAPQHAYAVMGYDPKSRMVTLYNPKGTDVGSPHDSPGYRTVPLEDFASVFKVFSVADIAAKRAWGSQAIR